jgi:cysteinyl-tRNA synthetase
VALNEAVTSGSITGGEKYGLLATWDSVLGLDLQRVALEGWHPTDEMLDLIRRRDEARQARDFTAADQIRKDLQAMGLEVMDTPDGTKIRPRA